MCSQLEMFWTTTNNDIQVNLALFSVKRSNNSTLKTKGGRVLYHLQAVYNDMSKPITLQLIPKY